MSDTTQSDVIAESSPQVEVVEEAKVSTEETEKSEKTETVEPEKVEEETDDSSLPNGVKKRIDKLTRQRYEAAAEANRYKAELEKLKAQATPKPVEPDISQFESFDDYANALAEHRASLKLQETQKQQSSQAEAQRMAQEWQAKAESVRKVAPDFDEVFAGVANVEFDPMALQAVAQHPKGAEIAYMMGKDLSEAYRIAALPPMLQVMAIGEIAAKASLPKPKTVSTAPPPVKPVSGSSSSNEPPKDMDAWVKWRNEQIRPKR